MQKLENNYAYSCICTSAYFKSNFKKLWKSLHLQIPITISISSNPERIKERVLLKGSEQDVTINDVDPKDWIKVIFMH